MAPKSPPSEITRREFLRGSAVAGEVAVSVVKALRPDEVIPQALASMAPAAAKTELATLVKQRLTLQDAIITQYAPRMAKAGEHSYRLFNMRDRLYFVSFIHKYVLGELDKPDIQAAILDGNGDLARIVAEKGFSENEPFKPEHVKLLTDIFAR